MKRTVEADYRRQLDRVALAATRAMLAVSPAAVGPPVDADGFRAGERARLAGLSPGGLAAFGRLLGHLRPAGDVVAACPTYWDERTRLLASSARH